MGQLGHPVVTHRRGRVRYERRHEPLLSRWLFFLRCLRHAVFASLVVGFALAIGVLGYRELEGLSWIDSLLNASMILGGMGPVSELHHDSAKLFASAYAIFSGLAFIAVAGILLLPAVHRVLHRFHLDDRD
jgi:hypothetical protein